MKRDNNTARRKAAILDAAVRVAERKHYALMTRQDIAAEAGVTGPLVQHYFGTMEQLRRAVMRKAVRDRVLRVIAQGLIAGNPHAMQASPALKSAARGVL